MNHVWLIGAHWCIYAFSRCTHSKNHMADIRQLQEEETKKGEWETKAGAWRWVEGDLTSPGNDQLTRIVQGRLLTLGCKWHVEWVPLNVRLDNSKYWNAGTCPMPREIDHWLIVSGNHWLSVTEALSALSWCSAASWSQLDIRFPSLLVWPAGALHSRFSQCTAEVHCFWKREENGGAGCHAISLGMQNIH